MQESVEIQRRKKIPAWLIQKNWDAWLETIGVLLLAIASLTAAWSGYQAAEWNGTQSTLYSTASTRRMESSQAMMDANYHSTLNVEMFNNFANAYSAGDTELMQFYERRFSDEMRVAVDAWLALDPRNNPGAPGSPFEMEAYKRPALDAAERLEIEATDLFQQGIHAGEQSDQYVLNTVYLAMTLFFAGIAIRIEGRAARTIIIALGSILLVYGVGHVMSLPVR